MTAARAAALAALAAAAVVLQVAVLRYVAVDGVVPDLALLLVVAAGFTRGAEHGALLGFGVGLLLDLAPPADQVAGRWALAFVVAGFLAGRVRTDARASRVSALVAVAACSFVATSLYALSGLVLGEPGSDTALMLRAIGIGVAWDVALAVVLLPALAALLGRLPSEGALS
ncbi:MAG: rod shape-determining protein MreD [Marmoricola sp.]